MSIATEISRLQTSRNDIRTKFNELGIAQSSDTLDKLATAAQNIASRGAVSVTLDAGETYTIPQGYHNGAGTVSSTAEPSSSPNLQSKTVTPTKAQQIITPDEGYDGLFSVTVVAIPGAYQDVSAVTADVASVLTGKVFVDATGKTVTGAMPNNGELAKTLDGLTEESVDIPAGYTSGGTVRLSDTIEKALAAI